MSCLEALENHSGFQFLLAIGSFWMKLQFVLRNRNAKANYTQRSNIFFGIRTPAKTATVFQPFSQTTHIPTFLLRRPIFMRYASFIGGRSYSISPDFRTVTGRSFW